MLCKEKKIQVVCDLNYRGKMWSAKDAQRVMRRLMSYVDVCIANDEDFESSLGIPAYDGDMSRGIEQIESYKEGMLEIQKQFPNCKAVASVLRNLYTVEDGDWMGIYLKDGKFVHASTSSGVIVSRLEEPYYRKCWMQGGRVKGL